LKAVDTTTDTPGLRRPCQYGARDGWGMSADQVRRMKENGKESLGAPREASLLLGSSVGFTAILATRQCLARCLVAECTTPFR